MSLQQKVTAVYVIAFFGGAVAFGLAAEYNTPLPGFVWLVAGGLATMLARSPRCGKSVFWAERRRTLGLSIGHTRFTPERVYSRCGAMPFEDASAG
jgi:hypothetical protein